MADVGPEETDGLVGPAEDGDAGVLKEDGQGRVELAGVDADDDRLVRRPGDLDDPMGEGPRIPEVLSIALPGRERRA